jgi:predicted dehydrogenase
MRLALVGCGFVAAFYLRTLPNHPQLKLLGVTDRDASRAALHARKFRVRHYRDLAEVLADPEVDVVVNLTNPRDHYAVTKAALEAGKHVYSEKPLGMTLEEGEELVELAERKGLLLSGAPCNVLSESAQTLWRSLREGAIGTPRVAYAELDEGPVFQMGYRTWASQHGMPWPWKDEFEVGVTLEHAAYYLSWLVAFFGPAKRVVSYASVAMPDKGLAVELEPHAPDFAVQCVEFHSGASARVTCSMVAPYDHKLRVLGDKGILSVDECWDYGAPVLLHQRTPLKLWGEKHPYIARALRLAPQPVKPVRAANFEWKQKGGARPMDFARGIADLADAVRERRQPRLSARFSLHVNELVLAMQAGETRELRTTCEQMEPMPWASEKRA